MRGRERVTKHLIEAITSVALAATSVAEAGTSLLQVLNQEGLSKCILRRGQIQGRPRGSQGDDNEWTTALRTPTRNGILASPSLRPLP